MSAPARLRLLARSSQKFSVHFRGYATGSPSRPRSTPVEIPPPKIDLNKILDNVADKTNNIRNRNAPVRVDTVYRLAELHTKGRAVMRQIGQARQQRSIAGKKVYKNKLEKKAASEPSSELEETWEREREEARRVKTELQELETEHERLTSEINSLALKMPNDTHPDVPLGPLPHAKILSRYGPRPVAPSLHRDHLHIARQLNIVDFESGAVTTGSSWYYLVNEGVFLEMALVNYALSVAVKHGFKPVTTPDVVRTDIASRCGFQPRDREEDNVSQMYHVSNALPVDGVPPRHPELVLAGTAEIPLAGMFANKLISPDTLPQKLVGLGHAFRAEAGARGAATRGLYRVHQFTKLELFAVTLPSESEAMMEEIIKFQIELYESLGLAFRVLDMPSGELGAAAYRKYDIEAWMPGRGAWGEISSTSNCTDYQARRLHIRASRKVQGQSVDDNLLFLHTLNGTAVAVPRLIVALLESGAYIDNGGNTTSLTLPKVLRPFWLGPPDCEFIRWR